MRADSPTHGLPRQLPNQRLYSKVVRIGVKERVGRRARFGYHDASPRIAQAGEDGVIAFRESVQSTEKAEP
ncbi:uncharacterized protein N7529_000416 [Penicillium soppii]|uniref:uncharacterized protein n=1 Tax=Penicillium soppii TaxID=69789 RepID=UPI002546F754|nr:uncharacterized protein N7529_000416 [Penicillium soppii]KAJ5881744.1 hypothetical protein N7529_000416 [Penicillium soppii]